MRFIISALLFIVIGICSINSFAFSFRYIPAAPNPTSTIGEIADTTNARFFAQDCLCNSPASIEADEAFTQASSIIRWNENTDPYNDGVCVCRVNIPSTGDYCIYPYYRNGGIFLVGLSDVRNYEPRFWSILPNQSSYGFSVDPVKNLNLTSKKLSVGTSGVQNVYIQGSQNIILGGIYLAKVDGSGNCTATPSLPAASAPLTPDYLFQSFNAITVNGNFSEDEWVSAINFPVSVTNNNTVEKATILWKEGTPDRWCGAFQILDADIQTSASTITNRDRVEIILSPSTDRTTVSTDTAKYIVDFLGNTDSKKWSGTGFTNTFSANMSASVADISGGKKIEVCADLPANFAADQFGLVQFMNGDKDGTNPNSPHLAFGTAVNKPDSWGIYKTSTTIPVPPPDTTPPTHTSTSEANITQTSATLCVNGLTDDRQANVSATFEWGTATGNYNLSTNPKPTVTVASGNNACTTVSNLPAGTTIFWRALKSDGINTQNTAEDSFTTTAANTFYVATTGNNANPGTSAQPWRTIQYGVNQMDPGETLIIKNGTYNETVVVNCASGDKSGTASSPITIKAENERQAFIKGDGSKDTFLIRYCSWWNIEGLRGENADNSNNTSTGHVFGIRDSNNINAKRLLARFPNRYANVHAIAVIDSNNILVEESEAYSFHRHGIMFFRSDNVTHRRNYANARDYPAIGTGSPGENNLNTGDECISFYQTNDGLNENSIAEGCGSNFTAHGDGGKGKRNKLLGAISVSGERSLRYESRTNTTASRIEDAIIQDFVAVNATVIGMYLRSTVNSQISNVTVYNNAGHGFAADLLNNNQSTSASFTCINCLSFNNSNRGFSSTAQASWLINFSNSHGNGGANYNPSETINDNSGNIRNSLSVAPTGMGLGTNQCIVYVPGGSNMKGAGEDSKDIGANIIYRYENGTLTSTKLWNQSTGQFPCGATVAGVNDDPNGNTVGTQACINVHKRLNVGVNGCAIP